MGWKNLKTRLDGEGCNGVGTWNGEGCNGVGTRNGEGCNSVGTWRDHKKVTLRRQ